METTYSIGKVLHANSSNKYLHNLSELIMSIDGDNDDDIDDGDTDLSGITLLDDCGVKCDGDNCDVNDNGIEDVR